MAANDEFPRGWTLSNNNNGPTICGITVPATPGVTHVLTQADWNMELQNAAAAPAQVFIQLTGAVSIFVGTVSIPAGAAGFTGEIGGWTGKFVSAVGGALTVAFSGNGVNIFQMLIIQGYDI